MYTINDAHNKGVTAIATTFNGQNLISGGGEGQVRVWHVTPYQQTMQEAMKEHKGKNDGSDGNNEPISSESY